MYPVSTVSAAGALQEVHFTIAARTARGKRSVPILGPPFSPVTQRHAVRIGSCLLEVALVSTR